MLIETGLLYFILAFLFYFQIVMELGPSSITALADLIAPNEDSESDDDTVRLTHKLTFLINDK